MTQNEPLKTNHEYEFFLENILHTTKNGGDKFQMVWSGVEVDYKIKERAALNKDGTAGPRLIELMCLLDTAVDGNHPPHPDDFFRKGMHLWANVQRHWKESVTDTLEFEFVYETIRGDTSTQVEITDAMKTKAKFILRKTGSVEKARALMAKEEPDLIPALNDLVRTGAVVTP